MQDSDSREEKQAPATAQAPKRAERGGARRFKLVGEEWKPLTPDPAPGEPRPLSATGPA